MLYTIPLGTVAEPGFLVGGVDTLGGTWTSDAGAFR